MGLVLRLVWINLIVGPTGHRLWLRFRIAQIGGEPGRGTADDRQSRSSTCNLHQRVEDSGLLEIDLVISIVQVGRQRQK